MQAEVICVSFGDGDDDNQAWVGGVIRNSSVPANIGQETGFRVEDNGQGANSPVDQISVSTFPVQAAGHALAWCAAQPNRQLNLVEQGNIQVR